MSIKSKQSKFNRFSRKITNSKTKKFDELIQEIPNHHYIDVNEYEYTFDYAEKLIKILEYGKSEIFNSKKFTEKNNFFDLIYFLESELISYNPEGFDYYNSEIHIFDNKVSLLIPSIFISDPVIFYVSSIEKIIPEFRTPFTILLKLVDGLSQIPFIKDEYFLNEFSDNFPFLNMDYENYQDNRDDEEFYDSEMIDLFEGFKELNYTDIEMVFYQYYNKDLNSFYNYKPKNETEKELKELFEKIIFYNQNSDSFFENICPTTESQNDGEMEFENLFLVFPKNDDYAEQELCIMDSYAQSGIQPMSVFLNCDNEKLYLEDFQSQIKNYYDFYQTINKIQILIDD